MKYLWNRWLFFKGYTCFPWIFNPGCSLNKMVNWCLVCRTNTLGWEQCDVNRSANVICNFTWFSNFSLFSWRRRRQFMAYLQQEKKSTFREKEYLGRSDRCFPFWWKICPFLLLHGNYGNHGNRGKVCMPSVGTLGHCTAEAQAKKHKKQFPLASFLLPSFYPSASAIVICCRILGSVAARAARSAIYAGPRCNLEKR